MPSKPRRKRSNKNFAALPINGTLALSTLGSAVVLVGDLFLGNLTEDFYAISTDLSAEITALTAGEGEPMFCGFAHGDYSVANIKEHLEVKLLGPGNKIEQEQTRRLIRKAGSFSGDGTNTQTNMRLGGRTGEANIRTKLKFVIQSGKTLNLYVYNFSGAALTTGATLRWTGTVYGRWIL